MYGTFIGRILSCIDVHEGTSSKDGRKWESRSYLFEVQGMRPYTFVFNLFQWIDGDEVFPDEGDIGSAACECVAQKTKEGKYYNQVNCRKFTKHG